MAPIDWSALVRAIVKTGMSQQELARACGCGQTTISDIGRGASLEPRAGTALHLLRIARERDVRVDGVADALAAVGVATNHAKAALDTAGTEVRG